MPPWPPCSPRHDDDDVDDDDDDDGAAGTYVAFAFVHLGCSPKAP